MSCKFKETKSGSTKPSCKVIDGECQFIKDGSETICPIQYAYSKLDPSKLSPGVSKNAQD